MIRSSCVAGVVGLVLVAGSAAGQYTFGGKAGGEAWTWENAGMLAFRNALANPGNFGAAGIVNASVASTTMGTVDLPSLAGINCFVAPAMSDGQFNGAEREAILTHFLNGGDLLLLNDSGFYDPIGELVGVPTSVNNLGSLSATGSGAPLFSGPFGNFSSVNQWYLVGAMNPADVAAHNGHVAATNAGGVAIAYWNADDYAPGAGKLVIITDVDTIAGSDLGYPGGANYGAMNDNARLGLNVANFFVVPTPGAGSVLMIAGIAGMRRRRN